LTQEYNYYGQKKEIFLITPPNLILLVLRHSSRHI